MCCEANLFDEACVLIGQNAEAKYIKRTPSLMRQRQAMIRRVEPNDSFER
jgi:hypothetical protein